jgi:DNA polymerase III alpha subunit
MVICDRPIADVCPVEWARVENRSVLQWDKDDCAAIGLVKFDLLGLGMLLVLPYAMDLVVEHKGIEVDLAKLDLSESAMYEMLARADSVGVFQVESRAQMATLPRLRPRVFYDLVVEVALIRPGPIQGGSVHPYIRRRNGVDPVAYGHPSMASALRKTLGVPLAGAVAHRQRPATAQGVTFINLEDETGMVNVLCTPGVWARHRKLAQTASALLIRGQVQNASGAVTVVAERLGCINLAVGSRSRDFR